MQIKENIFSLQALKCSIAKQIEFDVLLQSILEFWSIPLPKFWSYFAEEVILLSRLSYGNREIVGSKFFLLCVLHVLIKLELHLKKYTYYG